MAAGRTLKSLVGRRRRAGEDEEDEEGPVIVDDSQSEGSILSDADEDEEGSLGEPSAVAGSEQKGDAKPEAAALNGEKAVKKARKPKKKSKKGKEQASAESSQPQINFKPVADTEAMMNGLKLDEASQTEEAVDFESMDRNVSATSIPAAPVVANGSGETPAQRQRREHEEYRRKRDANPAFIPNRGNFFMHDTRGQQNGQPPQITRGGFAGRGGRGRGGGPAVGGPFSPANQMAQAERSAEQPWKHDLHDTINEESSKPADSPQQRDQDDSARLFPKPISAPSQAQPRVLNFSSTTLVGKVQIKISLPGMKQPIAYSEVPWKHYVRLPNHRPPLRRDKPVRVSLPDRAPHYIFPSSDRSFIFIPRQQRPSQQGYHRGGSYPRSVGGYGYSSRRTSMYGGSVYAPSVASRRSSMAMSRADAFSPTSFASGMPPPSRPVVRLPHGGQPFSGVTTPSNPMSGQHTPVGFPQIHTYPLPQQPTYQGTPTSTVHQPRPQKVVSVTGIESPALLQQPPSNEPQPFQNQLPAHMHETPTFAQQGPQSYYSPRQQYAAYPQQGPQMQAATPLSGIPEQAVHAANFQPPMPYGQSPFYPAYPPPQQQGYYYSPPGPNGYAPMPMYMPQQGYGMMPPPAQPQMGPPQQPPMQHPPSQLPSFDGQDQPPSGDQSGQPNSQMMAHESNGMVFYVPRSEVQEQDQTQQNYQPAESFVPSYAMPGLQMPPTPAPESSGMEGSQGYYYPPVPPMQQSIASGVAQGMFYGQGQ